MEGLALLAVALVWLFGALFVFVDATVNSSRSAILWGLVAVVGGLLGILLYVLIGRDETGEDGGRTRSPTGDRRSLSHVCQTCGEEYFADSSIEIDTCRNCGGIHVEQV